MTITLHEQNGFYYIGLTTPSKFYTLAVLTDAVEANKQYKKLQETQQ